jgi:hypothetical protein
MLCGRWKRTQDTAARGYGHSKLCRTDVSKKSVELTIHSSPYFIFNCCRAFSKKWWRLENIVIHWFIEKIFSGTKIVKTNLRNRIGDQL